MFECVGRAWSARLPDPGGGFVGRTTLLFGANLVALGGALVALFGLPAGEARWELVAFGAAVEVFSFYARMRRPRHWRVVELVTFPSCMAIAAAYVCVRYPVNGPDATIRLVETMWMLGVATVGWAFTALTSAPLPQVYPPAPPLPSFERRSSTLLAALTALATAIIIAGVVVPQQV